MTELICITCPKGCHLLVDEENDCAVTGNACLRGAEYGKNEMLHPVRVVTSTVRLSGGPIPRLPVKTDKPIPKGKVFETMQLLNAVTAHCPVHAGDVLLSNICGTDVNIVATKTMA